MPASTTSAPPQAAPAGGILRGTVKAGSVPLPGVAITATNTLTGRKYTTATDVDGAFAMAIPRTGRYVVKAELAAFAPGNMEVRLTPEAPEQTATFALELASRATAAEATTAAGGASLATQIAGALAAQQGGGTQSLSVGSAGDGLADASVGGGNAGAALPSLSGLSDSAASSADSVAVSGQQGQTNGLANFSEDQIRQRIEDAVAQARQQGGATGDQANAIVSMLGGMMGGGGFGGPGGPPGGDRGGGFNFRRFNPTQTHGNLFYQGGFSALNAQQFSLNGTPVARQGSYQNRFGASLTGSPYIPGLTKPSTKQFIFLNVTGARNLNPVNLYGTVPTALERTGDFSQTVQSVNGVLQPVSLYDPRTGLPFNGTGLQVPTARITSQAQALLALYPLPDVPGTATRNYQNVTTAGANSLQANGRYVRNFGAAGFGGPGGFGGGGRRGGNNGPATLRQNLNAGFSYSHNAQDLRALIPLLGGKTRSDGYGLSLGYTIAYGRLSNNASLNWNRSHAETDNYFTGTTLNPAAQAGVYVPSQAAQIARAGFYNGSPNIAVTNLSGLTEQQPSDRIDQTISFSDFVSYRRGKHNLRLGMDLRRLHADQLGGGNVTGTFAFSGLVTQSPADRARTLTNATGSTTTPTTGSALADFLLGEPQQAKIQAGLFKTYLRENIFDAYAQDDYRLLSNLTLNYGLRYEYFSPYVEKYNHLVNLDHNTDFTSVAPVLPGASGPYSGSFPRSLIEPDRTMFAPRLGVTWRPHWVAQTVVRAGYGINYNTGQFATFARQLAFQQPFATTQNNVLATAANATGCNIESPTNPYNAATADPTRQLTLASGFLCSTKAVQNTYAVNRNYRLGRVQAWNVDIQHTLPHGVVLNLGYNGSRGGNLDIVRTPNAAATLVTTANAQAFTYEDSVAESRIAQLTFSARKRMEKGIALQATYQYGHSIDNASSIGGTTVSQVQNDQRLDLEEGNSSFDVRHRLSGNFVLELPFGPGRAYLSQGGVLSRIVDGYTLSGDFTFASGTFFTPQYADSAAQLAAGGTYTLRPDRVFSQPIAGAGTQRSWFNRSAFVAPANGFGTASRNSIAGPGTVSVNMSFGRSFELGNTRSLEARLAAQNIFNTVQYTGIDTTVNSATYGQVTGTATQRRVTLIARYRF